ncbi:filamentous hemagglutinin outer membrane protein [Microseira wollei NIES-4236]|uniref:Filamentous hemagglutinin outer membrane protein n=1 Tax=Microseira wollei NIES-4236 TaxID=2530354 RepID=A0AAV3X6J7_9CYAN|nr:filamentous hemagglutinin outer membrane protein [Microseira wollei NIES-4236]
MAWRLIFPLAKLILQAPTVAQIVPDDSLGAERSVVMPDGIGGLPSDRIDGGAIRGSNLFHSFSEFNIQEGRGAYFSNPDGITNILTRVTGTNRSNILGTLGVLGNTNLFLINPNGIIFGSNARLDLRGSFLASSASGILFESFEFSTINPQATPLLTVNIPIGLRFRENPAAIVNQSAVSRVVLGVPTAVGLQVSTGQTLALVGGDLTLNSGNVTISVPNICGIAALTKKGEGGRGKGIWDTCPCF